MAIEMMELLAMLAQGRESELAARMAQKAPPPQITPPGAPGTQSGVTTPPIVQPAAPATPQVKNPEEEKQTLEKKLAAVLSSGVVPEATFTPPPPPAQAPGGGPSLGSASPAQPFNLTQPNVGGQSQLSLARLLSGGA